MWKISCPSKSFKEIFQEKIASRSRDYHNRLRLDEEFGFLQMRPAYLKMAGINLV